MSISILFFGATADVAGTRRLEMDVTKESIASKVFEDLIAKYPALSRHRLLYSVNQQYATGEELVRDGDELAVFTAVSGG